MTSPLSLKHVVALAITGLACLLILVVALTVEQAGVQRLEEEIGHKLKLIADQMQDRLDRTLFERYREIDTAAGMLSMLATADRPAAVRRWLSELQSTNPDYAWLGFADAAGKVTFATQGQLQGANVSNSQWFRAGLKDVSVGDVHKPELLELNHPGYGETAARLLDISAPVRDAQGVTIGVLGAQLDWSWARQVRDSLFGAASAQFGEEVLVLNRDRKVLLGPPKVIGRTMNIPPAPQPGSGAPWSDIRTWPDGGNYVTGYAHSDGHASFSGLGWMVLVRQRADVALAPVRRLQNQGLWWSIALAGLSSIAAWLLANRIAAPLLRLANAADAIRRGEQVHVPRVADYSEAATLSHSLESLVSELRQRQISLLELNQSLEAKVDRRTSELASQNTALNAAREAAEAAHLSKSRFLAAASHDLRQPLHAMSLFARALSRRVAGDEPTRLVKQLELSLASLKQMFDALLDVSRLDEGLIQPNVGPVAIDELLERVAGEFRAIADARGLRFECHGIGAIIATDAILLETMLRNLVSNALKFTRSGGVLLSARRVRGRIAFQVWDTGPGIAADEQAHVFDEFERSKEHAEGANEGLGLGLAIVRRYAELLDIGIELESRPGKGTRVSLVLPQSAQLMSGTAPSRPVARRDPRALIGLRILLLDDDRSLIAGMARELTDRGCRPLVYATIEEAEEALVGAVELDAAIVDFDLGLAKNGLQVLQAAERHRGTAVAAVILTGTSDPATIAAIQDSKRAWLKKPADPNSIMQCLLTITRGQPQSENTGA